jgi:hypothetical protein
MRAKFAASGNGIAPYTHWLPESGARVGDGEWMEIPSSLSNRFVDVFTFDNYDGWSSRHTHFFSGLPAPISIFNLYTYPTTRTGASNGVALYDMSLAISSDNPATISYVRMSDQVEVYRTTTPSRWIRHDSLPSGNLTATITARGCSYSFNLTIADPPAPIINDFTCRLVPVDQVVACTWSRPGFETYRFMYAVAATSVTTVPDPDAFVTTTIYEDGFPTRIGYVPGKSYFFKLIANGAGGAVESVVRVDATIARPALPASVRGAVQMGGVVVSWTLPDDPIPDEVGYDVYLDKYSVSLNLGPLLASNVSGLSVFVNTSVLDGARFLSVGDPYYYVVLARSVTTGLASFIPTYRQSASQTYLRTPGAPEIFYSIAFERFVPRGYSGSCDIRCAYLNVPIRAFDAGGPQPVDVTIEYKYTGSDDSKYVQLWTGSSGGSEIYVVLPRLPFGFYATIRVAVMNAIGVAYSYKELIISELPLQPRLTFERAATGNIEKLRVTISCVDQALAVGVQPSTFRYEYVYDSISPDWSRAMTSPEISGPFVSDFPSNDTFLFARCVAINPAGETYNMLGDAKIYMPPPFRTPDNLRLDILGKVESKDEIVIMIKWDFAAQRAEFDTLYFFDLRVYGDQWSNAVSNFTDSDSTRDKIFRTRARCRFGFSIRARNDRGATGWSEDLFQVINYPPRAPFGVAFPGTSNLQRNSSAQISALLVPRYASLAADAILTTELQMTTNITNPADDSNWVFMGSFTTDDLLANRVSINGQAGVLVPFNFSVSTRPTIIYTRTLSYNGLTSGWAQGEILIVADPAPPVLTSQFDFHPTNASVTFTWPPPIWIDVVFPYECVFTPLVGAPTRTQGVISNQTISFYGIAAGTVVSIQVRAATNWRQSDPTSASVLVASGNYWPSNSSTLVPNVTRISPLSARVSWRADRTAHGFNTTMYQLLVSLGENSPIGLLATIYEPDIQDGVISYVYSTATQSDRTSFMVVPFNPLGYGPPSNASELTEFRPNREYANSMRPSVESNTRTDSTATIFAVSFQQPSRATAYKMFIRNTFNPLETQLVENITCCTAYFSGDLIFVYEFSMSFFDPFYGWLANSPAPSRTAYTPGLAKVIEFESFNLTANLTGAWLDTQFALARSSLTPSLNTSEIYMALRVSIAGLGVWQEQVSAVRNCFERNHVNSNLPGFKQLLCSARFWYSSPPPVRIDVQIAAGSIVGRTGWTDIRSSWLCGLPATVQVTLDDSDPAIKNPLATNGSLIRLPIRWPHQRPFGSVIEIYFVRVFTICELNDCYSRDWQEFPEWGGYPDYNSYNRYPARLLCGLPGSVDRCPYAQPFFEQWVVPASPSDTSFEVWTPINFGLNHRVVIFGRNAAGLIKVADRTFLPLPVLPIWNVEVDPPILQGNQRYSRNTMRWSMILPTGYRRFGFKLFLGGFESGLIAEMSGPFTRDYSHNGFTDCKSNDPSRPLEHDCYAIFELYQAFRIPADSGLTVSFRPFGPLTPATANLYSLQRRLTFPGMWTRAVLPGTNVASPRGFIDRFQCNAISPVRSFGVGPNGTRTVERVLHVGLVTASSNGFKYLTVKHHWRDGSVEDRTQDVYYVYATPPRYAWQQEASYWSGQFLTEFAYIQEGGIVDIEATVFEERSFPPDYTPVVVSYTARTTCTMPTPPRAPIRVTTGLPQAVEGMCRLPINVTVNGVTGYIKYTHLVVDPVRWTYQRRSQSSVDPVTQKNAVGSIVIPVADTIYDPISRTFSASILAPLDNFVAFEVSLVNDAGLQGFSTSTDMVPVFCGQPRTASLNPTGAFVSAQGNLALALVPSPPLPNWLIASPTMRIRIDNQLFTLPYNNITNVNVPPIAVGPHTFAVSMDNFFWGPEVTLYSVAVPLSPSVQAPSHFDARRPGAVAVFSDPGFRGLSRVICYFGNNIVDAIFSDSRTAVSCTIPTLLRLPPTTIPVVLSLDGTNTSVLTQIVFWGTLSSFQSCDTYC